MTEVRLTHAFTFFRGMGGVQTVLRRHVREDARWGLNSHIIAHFDPDAPANDRVRGLGLTWRNTVHQARARFACAIARIGQPQHIAYVNFWGLPFYAAVDKSERRIGVLHSDWPGLPDCLRQVRSLLDGVLCVCPPLLDLVRETLIELPEDRVEFLPCPVDRAAPDTLKPPLAGRPLVIGFCGRISREQKRVDRFPAAYEALVQAGVDFRLEFLGEGPQEVWLRKKFVGQPRVVFHGRQGGQAYWDTLRNWDVILFTSDYEGLPIALMEAMSMGVAPVYPRIGCGGGEYVRQADESLWYKAGDLGQLVAAIRKLQGMPRAELEALRDRCGNIVRRHLGDEYLRTFSSFVHRISKLPRISKMQFPPRPFYWSDHCPFGLLRRFYMPGFWRRDEGAV